MKVFNKGLVACAVTAALTIPMTAMATNGYFAHGYGTKSKGMAGGGVALSQDAMAGATNPAGMVEVGNRMDLGVALFSPSSRGYTVSGTPSGFGFSLANGSYESDNDVFLIPHFARNWMLDSDSSVGVSVYGNGGMNTEFAALGPFGGGETGVNLEQLFINTTYSRKIDETSSWGASVIAAYQTFEAKGLGAFAGFSEDGANMTNNGKDTSTGLGIKLGWQGEVSKGLTLAASYQSEIGMGKFDKYAGLFAEQGGFDIPATWTLGLAFDVTPKSILTFDIQNIMYSDVASIANPMSNFTVDSNLFGSSNGAGFGWDDMTIYKLGYQWETSADWTWRAGISMTEQPIASSEVMLNILAPAVMETHLTGGFTMKTGKDSEFSLAAMYAPTSTVSGANPMDGPNTQTIELEMTQFEVEASWAWKF